MKALLTFLTIILVSPSVCLADHFDEVIDEQDAYDENYVYQDMALVQKIIEQTNHSFESILPMNLNNGLEATSAVMELYSFQYDYRYLTKFDENQLALVKGRLLSPETIQNLCETFYNNYKFLAANGIEGVYKYNDIEGDLIVEIRVNEESCKS